MKKNYQCHDCQKILQKNDEYMEYGNEGLIKCKECHQKDPLLRNFRKTEVYSRVVGYIRPVSQWNPGKKEEFRDRVNFRPTI